MTKPFSTKQAILFDLDGTLTDPKEGITKSVAYALAQEGIMVHDLDTLCPFIGPPLKEMFMSQYGFNEAKAELAIANYRVYFKKQGMFENIAYPGIKELLALLCKQGKALYVATSKPTVFAKEILAHFHLASYFTDICGSEFDGTRSKKADVIRYVLKQHQLCVSDCVMIGDRKHDILGAKENDMASIGVLYGYGSLEELRNAQADAIVASIQDLQDILTA